jgi:hypothetical protein
MFKNMSKISISVYKISINKKGKKSEAVDLDDFENGNDLLNIVKTLPSQFRKINSNNPVVDGEGTNRRTVIPNKDFEVSGRIISGYIDSGDYGYETPIVNPDGDIVGTIDKENSLMRPFYFFINIPKNSKKGFLLIQRFENFGVYTIFSKMLRQVFNDIFLDYTLSITPEGIDNSEAINYLQKGKISKASFAIWKPSNIPYLFSNNNQNDAFDYNDIKAEIVISSKRNREVGLKNTAINLLTGKNSARVKLTDQDIPFEKLKIYVKLGREEKMIDLSKWDTFSKDIDVTNDVKNDPVTGLPTKVSLNDKCHEILSQLIKN